MNTTEQRFNEIRKFCEANNNPEIVKKYSKFFKEGYDAFGLTQEIMECQRDAWFLAWKDNFTLTDAVTLADKLFATGKYEEGSFAIWFILKFGKQFSFQTFREVGNLIEKYVNNWAHSDVISGEVLYIFLKDKIVQPKDFSTWINSASKWMRRTVPVSFIKPLKKGFPLDVFLEIIDPLMADPIREVHQGLGWFLREAWKLHPVETEIFLMKWKDICGRLIIQYATEKMDKNEKEKFKKTKKK
jgi:3-methyladenine DNA glycosylase AlkD